MAGLAFADQSFEYFVGQMYILVVRPFDRPSIEDTSDDPLDCRLLGAAVFPYVPLRFMVCILISP